MNIRSHLSPLLAPRRLYTRYFAKPRALNDYSTHVPVLIGLARLREIKNVLEFGCGHYSTRTFLNRAAFPHLERLESIENDPVWVETLRDVAKDDDRWKVSLIDGEIAGTASDLDLEAFDLILVDDSKTSSQRASTIRAIESKSPQRAWIVIHDYEVEEYRAAARGFKYRHAFKAYNPQTGIVANEFADVRSLDRLLNRHCKLLQPDDLQGWLNALGRGGVSLEPR